MLAFFWKKKKKKVGSGNDFLCDIKYDPLLLGDSFHVCDVETVSQGKLSNVGYMRVPSSELGKWVCAQCAGLFFPFHQWGLLIASNRLSDPAYLSKGGFISWTAEQHRVCTGLREGWIPEGWQSYHTSDFSSSLCSEFCHISLIICLHTVHSIQQLQPLSLCLILTSQHPRCALLCFRWGPLPIPEPRAVAKGVWYADEPVTLELKPGTVHLKQMAATQLGRGNCSKSEYSQQKEDNGYWKAIIKCPLNAFYLPGAPSGIQKLRKLF